MSIYLKIATGFLAGVLLGTLSIEEKFLTFILLMILASISGAYFFLTREENNILRHSIRIVLFWIFLIIGIFYFTYSYNSFPQVEEIALQDSIGKVIKEPNRRINNTQLTVDLENDLRVLITYDGHPKYLYGDVLKITGTLSEPVVFPDFNYKDFLKKEGVNAVMYYPDMEVLENDGNKFLSTLYVFKNKMRGSLKEVLPYPENTVAGAMILGDGKLVPNNIQELFSRVGIRHITAISGMHITIIAGILIALISSFGFGRNFSFYAVSVLIGIYVLFVGAPASAVRAGIMAFIFLLAFKTGKVYNSTIALSIAGLLIVIVNPLSLGFDVGFQLSFLATLGILYITPFVEKLLGRENSFLKLQEKFSVKDSAISILSISIGAYLAVLPIVAHTFGVVSFSSPIANLIAIPLVPIVIISSAVGALSALLSVTLGYIFSLPALFSLSVMIKVSEIIDKIPMSSIEVEGISFVSVFFIYSSMIFFFLFLYKRKKKDPIQTLK